MKKMKRLPLLCLSLLLTLSLCACGGVGSADLGKYTCTSIVMNGMDLGASKEWIELKEDGQAALFMQNETHSATYSLEGGVLTLTNMDGNPLGSGTLEGGKLTMDLMGMTCIFQLEGTAG